MGLTPFEHRDVLATKVAITMEIEPDELELGTTVYVLLECSVDKVRFEPLADTDALIRIHVLRAGTATLVDEKMAAKPLDAQRRRIERARGVERLPLDDQ
jgi:hypothetical protein